MASAASAKRRARAGFSLVEMMVALVFMAILMAGLAVVFKSSISNLYTSGEKVSSSRRNRLAMDLLYEDINSAGMFISDMIGGPSGISAANPLFYILPNQSITGYTLNGNQQYADQLYFYMDQPLAFLGQLMTGSSAYDPNSLAAPVPGVDNKFIVNCQNNAYTNQVYNASLGSLHMVLMDSWDDLVVTPMGSAPGSTDTSVTVYTSISAASNASWTGQSSSGTPKFQHNPPANVLFYIPAQMVRYSVQMLNLDPNSAAGVPCLVRDQGTYSSAGFAASQAQQVIAENVTGFKVYLSPDPGYLSVHNPGQTWAPFNAPGNNPSLTTGWTNGILADFNTQLATVGRPGVTSLSALATDRASDFGLAWFRSIPAVVRLDITTQTAAQRTEYSATGKTLANASLTRSLVIVPRNFGLPMGN